MPIVPQYCRPTAGERSLSIGTSSDQANLDLDLFLFADFENSARDWTAEATLSGAGFREELVPAVIDGNIIQFSVRELLADGEYMAQVQILGADGVVIGEHHWSFSIETMSSTTGIGNQ